MKRKSKYRKGRRIKTFSKLVRELETNGKVFWAPDKFFGWFPGKVLTWGFLQNWQTRLVLMFLRNGAFYECRRRKVRAGKKVGGL